MKRIILLTICLGYCLIINHAFAATYYISSTSGSDNNTPAQAQSKSTPWAHLPCMANVTGNAAAYVPVAGDTFILKGGDSWTHATLPCRWIWSGTSSNRITITADQTWYTGNSWVRPKFDAGGSAVSGVAGNIMLWDGLTYNLRYVTFSWLELTGFHWDGVPSYAHCDILQFAGSTYLTLDNLYVHGWTHGSYADGTRDPGGLCHVLLGMTTAPFGVGNILQNSVVDGSDSTGGGDSMLIYAWPVFLNNVLHDYNTLLAPIGDVTVAGNLVYNCHMSFMAGPDFANASHANVLLVLGGATSGHTVYIHDNVFQGGDPGCESMFIGNPGETDYVWNNLWYNMNGNAPSLPQLRGGVAAYIWNNTIVPPSGQYCLIQGQPGTTGILEFRNNHCITTNASATDPTLSASTLIIDHNLLQTPEAASAQGLSSAQNFAYSPTNTLIGSGIDLSNSCTGPRASLCNDTSYGQRLDPTLKMVGGPARTAINRSLSGTWNIGAYQFGGSGDNVPPAPPTYLTVR